MSQFIDDEQRAVVHKEPTKAKRGQRQRRIRRSNSGEPLIGRDSVVIQADKESKTDTLIQVMDAARSAGVFNVSIAAQEP